MFWKANGPFYLTSSLTLPLYSASWRWFLTTSLSVLQKNLASRCPTSWLSCEICWLLSHSVVADSAIPWTAARQAALSFTISQSLLKLMSIELVMPFDHPILCRPFLLLSTDPSIRVFSSESALCIRLPKYWSFRISFSISISISISPSSESV